MAVGGQITQPATTYEKCAVRKLFKRECMVESADDGLEYDGLGWC